MNKIKRSKSGFEVLKTDQTGVVYKRVIASKGRKPKEVQLVELSLPKVKMVYFTDSDLERLHDLEVKISSSYKSSKKGKFIRVYEGVKKFMTD